MKYLVFCNSTGKWVQSLNHCLFTSNIEYAHDFESWDFAERWVKSKTFLSLSVVKVSRIKTIKTQPMK